MLYFIYKKKHLFLELFIIHKKTKNVNKKNEESRFVVVFKAIYWSI
jgi:hypothetical protein